MLVVSSRKFFAFRSESQVLSESNLDVLEIIWNCITIVTLYYNHIEGEQNNSKEEFRIS